MNRMTIGPVVQQSDGKRIHVSAAVSTPDANIEIWFRAPEGFLSGQPGDPFLAACLIPCMKLGLPLHIQAPVSRQLLSSVQTIQQIFHKWYPDFAVVPVKAQDINDSEHQRAKQSAAFFSGGLDSFYTVLKNLAHIDQLIFVHGFDVSLENETLRGKVIQEIRQSAQALGKPLIEVETNLRELGDRYVSWSMHLFGPALASVSLLLGKTISRIYIPSSESFAHLEPCASHPLVDPLWSTEKTEIIHDGGEATRNEKAAFIAHSNTAMRTLRVCWETPDNAYNCGRCEKCLRTMINLESAGALERCTTFERKLEPAAVANMKIGSNLVLFHVEENLRVLEVSGRNPAVVEALRAAISKYKTAQLNALFTNIQENSVTSDIYRQLILNRRERAFKMLWQTHSNWVTKEVFKENLKRLLGRKH